MAAITSAAVNVLAEWDDVSKGGKLVQHVRRMAITLAAQGGTNGDVPASALGFAEIYSAESYGLDTSGGVAPGTMVNCDVAVAIDGSQVWPTSNTAGFGPINTTGVWYITVRGRSLI